MTARSSARRVLGFGALLALASLGGCGEDPTLGPEPGPVSTAVGGNGNGRGGNGGGGNGGGGDEGLPDPTVDATDPSSTPQGTTIDVRVLGSGYEPGSTVEILLDLKSTRKVETNSTTFVSDTELVANVTVAEDAAIDLYDVRVATPRGKKGVGIELIAITAAERYEFSVVMRDGSGGTDALRADCTAPAACPYVEGQEHVGAHFTSVFPGNLMFWLNQLAPGGAETQRRLTVDLGGALDYPAGPALTRRIYTNTNQPDVDLRLLGESGPASVHTRLYIELPSPPGEEDGRFELRFGVDCFGDDHAASRALVTRTGGFGSGPAGIGDVWHWTMPGGSFLCRTRAKGKRTLEEWAVVGGTGFGMDMTLVAVTPNNNGQGS